MDRLRPPLSLSLSLYPPRRNMIELKALFKRGLR